MRNDLLELSCPMGRGVFGEDTLAGALSHPQPLLVRERYKNVYGFLRITRKQDLFTRRQKLVEPWPIVR